LKNSASGEPEELPLPEDLGQVASLRRMWEDYAEAIIIGSSARVAAADGHAAIGLIETAYLSAGTSGTPIEVADLAPSSAI
jgi:hypothetical protein